MSFPVYSEYSISSEGVSTMTSEPHPSTELPEIIYDLIPNVMGHLPLLKQMELVDQPSEYQNLLYRILRRTNIKQIILWPEESEGLVRVDVSIFEKEGMTVDFEGNNYRITKDTYTRAFDYVMKILALTNCANASLTIESVLFPGDLETTSLLSRRLCHVLIPVNDLNWALGAPLELFVQLNPAKVSCDTSIHNRIDGILDIQQKIQAANLHPVLNLVVFL